MEIFGDIELINMSFHLSNLSIEDLGKFKFKNIKEAYSDFLKISGLKEIVILEKCNCVEIFAFADSEIDIVYKLLDVWKKHAINFDESKSGTLQIRKNRSAISHLFATACGLKSVLLGDAQVLGQVRDAAKISKENDAIGVVLDNLFSHARIVDDRVKKETTIHQGYTSLGRIAGEIVTAHVKDKSAPVALLGFGAIGEIAFNKLVGDGFTNITICNRNLENLKFKDINIKFLPFEERYALLNNMHAVICCVGINNFIITKDALPPEINKELLLIDLGNPPNVSPDVPLNIINLDKIKMQSRTNFEARKEDIDQVENVIDEELFVFLNKLKKIFTELKIRDNMRNFSLNLSDDKNKSIFLFRDRVFKYLRDFLREKEFVEVQTPMITATATDPIRTPEGELFTLDWFGKKAYLRQSNQLYKQALVISGLNNVFELGPMWRAEERVTKRHLCESWVLDIETTNISSHRELMCFLENLIIYVINKLNKDDAELLYKLNVILPKVKKPFHTISYLQAVKMLKANGIDIKYGEDIGVLREKVLFEILNEKRPAELFFIEHYPNTVKKFYVKNIEGNLTNTFDLIFKGWELCSGAQRETNLEKIKAGLAKMGLNESKYNFYLSLFKENVPEHGGFGFGVDRFIAKLLNFDDVRKVVLFPRDQERLIP